MNINFDFLMACEKGNFEEVEKFLKKFIFKPDVNVQSKDLNYAGGTALHIVSIKGFKDIADLLIKKGTKIDARNNEGHTPLYHACYYNKTEIIELLIDKGADINVISNEGEPLFYSLAKSGKKELALFLINKGADLDIVNEKGNTPLYMALDQEQYEIAEMLINNGANVNSKNNSENSSLHMATFKRQKDIIELLLSKGADVNAKDDGGRSVLHNAVSYAGVEIVELLIKKGADVNAQDEQGFSVLHFAYRKGKEMIRLLLREGASIDAKDNDGNTILHWAVKNKCIEEAETLIKWGAYKNANNNSGKSPIDFAYDMENKELIRLFSKSSGVAPRLVAIVIVFNREFPSAGQFAQEILMNLTTFGKTYKSWMQNDTPVIIRFHQNAQDQITAATIALVEFKKLLNENVDPGNFQFGTFEGSQDIFGSVLSYWR